MNFFCVLRRPINVWRGNWRIWIYATIIRCGWASIALYNASVGVLFLVIAGDETARSIFLDTKKELEDGTLPI